MRRPACFPLLVRAAVAGSRWWAAVGLTGLLLAGCGTVPKVEVNWRGGPFFHATNFTGLDTLPAEVLRVAVLPPSGLEEMPTESTAGFDAALQMTLTTASRFETVFVPPGLVRTVAGRNAIASTEALPPELFDRVARDFGADAVLFTDVTLLRSYPPLALGVRLKLVRLQGNRPIIWAFDQVFDCRNPAVANSAQLHAVGGKTEAVDAGSGVLHSPSRFADYVLTETFSTLPRRSAAPSGPIKVPRKPAD